MAVAGITPKCFIDMSPFLSADGTLYPCCFVYTRKEELEEWAKNNNADIQELNVTKYTSDQVHNSNFMKKFNQSFDIHTCHRECGKTSYNTSLQGQPKWETYKSAKKA